ncbi:MAG: hypothetical protein J5I98_29225 [Phaeodactylibacter sp.]|nr:hypothetical protein [Phaeodactylibacter sp.]
MMNHTNFTFAQATLLFGVVFLLPAIGTANLGNYLRINKGIVSHLEMCLSGQDTIPVREQENFDETFGSPAYRPHDRDPFADKEEAPPKVIQPQKVGTDDFKPRLYKIPESYSGFRIEIKRVDKPLAASHDIFFQHGKVFAEKLKDGTFSYLLGDFSDAEEANKFLGDFLKQRYPKARVVEYEAGERLY